MNQDLERRADSWVEVREDIWKLAAALAQTTFVPKAFRGNPPAVAAVILTGREMGLGPMASLRGIDSIDGKPSLSTQMTAARIYAAGHTIQWVESTDQRATVRIIRGDGLGTGEASWTMNDAQRAGLAGKTNWRNYPRHMLKARALSEAAAMVCPDVVLGIDAREDVAEDQPSTGGSLKTIRTEPNVDAGPSSTGETAGASGTNDNPVVLAVEPAPPDMVDRRQLMAIHARIGALEGKDRKLTEDQRRDLIAKLAGVDALASAKDLTAEQAGRVLDHLANMRRDEDGA